MPTFEYVHRDGGVRCYRGSSHLHDESYAVDAIRSWDFPDSRRKDIGFRLTVDCEKAPIRGSNWYYSVQNARGAHHFRYVPSILNNDTGFRLATSEGLQHEQP